MADPVYVTSGAWGAGNGGVPLSAAAIDTNFYRVVQRIETLEYDPPVSPYPISISLAGTSFTMGLSNGTTLGPITFTIPMPSWRGPWAPDTVYQGLNFITAPDGALGAVLVPHTSAAVFDWAATDDDDNLLYQSISGSATGALSGLSDVLLTSPVAGEVLRFNGTAWVNTTSSGGGSSSWRGAAVTISVDQSISNNTETAVEWSDTVLDTDGIWGDTDPTMLIVPEGVTKIRLTGGVQWGAVGNTTGIRHLFMMKNGSVLEGGGASTIPAGVASIQHDQNVVSRVLSVEAGDGFELMVYQSSGGSLVAVQLFTWFEMEILE